MCSSLVLHLLQHWRFRCTDNRDGEPDGAHSERVVGPRDESAARGGALYAQLVPLGPAAANQLPGPLRMETSDEGEKLSVCLSVRINCVSVKVRTCLSVWELLCVDEGENLSVCLSVRTNCVSVKVRPCLSVCLSVRTNCVSVKVRPCLSVCLRTTVCRWRWEPVCLWGPTVCQWTSLSVCPSVCLYQLLGPVYLETPHEDENLSVHIHKWLIYEILMI